MQNSGYIPESYKFKDFSFEKVYGTTPSQPIIPLNRDVSGVPVIYQGDVPACVSCSASFVRSYMEQTHPSLSWQWLANVAGTTPNGVQPSQVFEAARKQGIAEDMTGKHADEHKIGAYFYVRLTPQAMYAALKTSVLAIGLTDWQGAGPHFVVAYDVSPDGTALKCKNWWDPTKLDDILVPFDIVDDCIAFGEAPADTSGIAVNPISVIVDKFSMLSNFRKIVGGFILAILAALGTGVPQNYGAAGVPGEFATQLAQAVQSTDTSIPVISNSLFTGEKFDDTSLFHPINVAIGRGSTREYASCGFFSTTGTFPTFQNCQRGTSALSTSTAVTVVSGAAFAHTAGETVSITNQPAYFANFVDIFTAQTVAGIKTITGAWVFNTFPHTSSTTALPVNSNDFATKIYVDNVGAGGFTASNVSSTLGLQAIVSGVPNCPTAAACVGINASTTAGLAFDGVGRIYVNASSTASTNGGFLSFNSLGQLYWNVTNFLAGAWTWVGNQTFSGTTIFNGAVTITTSGTSGSSVPNAAYVNNNTFTNAATGTAGTNIGIGQTLRSNSDGNIYLTAANATTTVYNFIGVAMNTTTTGGIVTYVKPGGIFTTSTAAFTSVGNVVYESDTAGAFGTTPGTILARIGRALSSTSMLVLSPTFYNRAVGSVSLSDGATTTISTVWTPSNIRFTCPTSRGGSSGEWMADNSGNSQSTYVGNKGTPSPFLWLSGNGFVCRAEDGSSIIDGVTVVTSTSGFSVGLKEIGGSGDSFTAFYDASRNDDYDIH